MSSPGSNSGASQRASEITSAMLNVPGYADDSMLFMLRYGASAKETLRKVDWDEFQLRISAMNAHWHKSHKSKGGAASASDDSVTDVAGCRGTGGDGADLNAEAVVAARSNAKDSPIVAATAASDDAADPAEPGPETDPEAAELKARTLELIQDFPRLVRDFDRFVECTRIMMARYKR
ncbi:hypothetical protein ACHAPE_000014 [Trichoderma viride]